MGRRNGLPILFPYCAAVGRENGADLLGKAATRSDATQKSCRQFCCSSGGDSRRVLGGDGSMARQSSRHKAMIGTG